MFNEVLVLIVLILLNAFFAASEIALISLNDNKVKMMAEAGNKKAKLLQKLLSEPSRFLATIQIGITLAGFMASAFAAQSFAERLAHFLFVSGVPIAESTLQVISVILITLVLSYFTLVFGELVPKRLAMQKAEAISALAVRPLNLLAIVTYPFVKLLTLSTNMIVRLFGVDPQAQDDNVTEEEIRMLVDVGEENGTIQISEKIMINNIFEFDNKLVSDIMTHRTNIVGIPVEATLKEIVTFVNEEQYTRFPVYEDSIDKIIGILHVKDLLTFMETGDENKFDIHKLIRQPFYVISSRKSDALFRELQKNKIHMAVVIDEYGGTDGIITIEDLIEEIVGHIFDEYDDPEEENEIKPIDDHTFIMDGTVSLYEVKELLRIDLPVQEYDTLSGFVISQLGKIPSEDEKATVEFEDVLFKVEQVDERRVSSVRVINQRSLNNVSA